MYLVTIFCLEILIFLSIQSNKPIFRFTQESTFRILHLTDFHFGEGDSDEYNVQGIYKILKLVQPTLVIVTGDLVSDYSWNGGSEYFQTAHEKFVQPFVDLKIPYILTLGNHDDGADLNREQILNLDKTCEQSYTMNYPFHSSGSNYYVPIYDNKGETEILRIWSFDSNDYGCAGHTASWGCVERNVIKSYQRAAQGQTSLFSLAAMHIPPPEFLTLRKQFPTFGLQYDQVACSLTNTGLVDALLSQGHNHNNDFGGFYRNDQQEIKLMFGRKSGYGGYALCCGSMMGGRVMDFSVTNGNQIKLDHFIMTYDNKLIKEDKMIQHSTRQTSCSMNFGSGWNAYEAVVMFIILWFILILNLIFLLCFKYSKSHSKISLKSPLLGENDLFQ